ncbi:MAG: hypothetical protein AAF460_00820 [Pseudomonadota bacterium]
MRPTPRFTRARALATAVCAGAVIAASGTAYAASSDTAVLHGEWRSLACELRPQAGPDGVQDWYLTRRITFSENRIDAHFTNYADPACQTPVLELAFGGDVTVLGPSEVAPGALNVDLVVNDYLRLTPRVQGIADYLNSDPSCGAGGWAPDTEQDVFTSGCAAMGVNAASPTTEYEVLYVNGGRLFFGARPVDGKPLATPDARPGALQMPLTLAQGGTTQRVGAGDTRVPTAVEIVMFEQQLDADPAEVRAFFETITVRMNQNDTLLYRSVAQGKDGTWLCVNYWTSIDDMRTLNQQAQTWKDAFATMGALAKPESFRLSSYRLGGG